MHRYRYLVRIVLLRLKTGPPKVMRVNYIIYALLMRLYLCITGLLLLKKKHWLKVQYCLTADWLNAFYLPADCLVVRSISGRSSAIGRDYAIIGKQLHCNESNVLLRYVHRVAPVDMPAFFEAYVVNKLASEMSNIITGSNTMTSTMRTIANEAFSIAKNTDALSQSPKTMPQSALVIKRRGW